MSEGYDLSAPDRITVGTVGPVGDRLFLLQCRQGPTLLTLKIEKQQVAVVADYLARIVRDQERPGHLPDELELEEPAEPAWAVGHHRCLLRRCRRPGHPGHRGAGPRGRDRRHRPAVDLARAGGGLRHPGHTAGRVRPSALPAVRVTPRPVRTRVPPDQRPPSAGGVNGWSPGPVPGSSGTGGAARPGEITVVGRLPWSSNLTFLVGSRMPTEADPLHAVYKPASGEQSLWDFPDGLYRREVAAYALSEALGWGLVPPTVERDDGPFGPGSLQLFVAADYEQHYFTLFEEGDHEADAPGDVRLRRRGQQRRPQERPRPARGPDGRLWGIDHGLCFHRQPKLRTVIWDFADEDVPAALLADLGGWPRTCPTSWPPARPRTSRRPSIDRIDGWSRRATFPSRSGTGPPTPGHWSDPVGPAGPRAFSARNGCSAR